MNRKAEISIKDWSVATGIFVLVMFSGAYLISSGESDIGFVDQDRFENFNNSFNKFNQFQQEAIGIADQASDVSGSSEDSGTTQGGEFDFVKNLFNRAWNTLRLIPAGFSFMSASVGAISEVFPVPFWLTSIIVSIIGLVIGFRLLGVAFNKNP